MLTQATASSCPQAPHPAIAVAVAVAVAVDHHHGRSEVSLFVSQLPSLLQSPLLLPSPLFSPLPFVVIPTERSDEGSLFAADIHSQSRRSRGCVAVAAARHPERSEVSLFVRQLPLSLRVPNLCLVRVGSSLSLLSAPTPNPTRHARAALFPRALYPSL